MAKSRQAHLKKQKQRLKRSDKKKRLQELQSITKKKYGQLDPAAFKFRSTNILGNKSLNLGKILVVIHKGKFEWSQDITDRFIEMVNSSYSYKTINKHKGQISREEYDEKCLYSISGLLLLFVNVCGIQVGSGGMTTTDALLYGISQLHKINDLHLRFMLMTWAYQQESKNIDFNEYKKLANKISFNDRIELSNNLHGKRTIENEERDNAYIKQFFKKGLFSKDEYIEVYRSFRVKRGENIREAVKRHSLNQEHGLGNSFSNIKACTFRTGNFINNYMVKKYSDLDTEFKVHSKLQSLVTSRGRMYGTNDDRFNDSFGVLGKYRVKKSKVITVSDTFDTQEFIIDGKDVELIEYRFLNMIDYITCDFMIYIIYTGMRFYKTETDQISRMKNIDVLYDFFYWHISKMDFVLKDKDFYLLEEYIKDRVEILTRIQKGMNAFLTVENKVTNVEESFVSYKSDYWELVFDSDQKQFCGLSADEEEFDRINLEVATDLRQNKKNWNQYTVNV